MLLAGDSPLRQPAPASWNLESSRLELNLFNDIILTAAIEQTLYRNGTNFLVTGVIDGWAQSRLTLVADPDGLLTEEGMLSAIRDRGFDLIPFDDPIAFRFAYESQYRSRWDQTLIALGFHPHLWMIQIADLGGIYLVSFAVVAVNGATAPVDSSAESPADKPAAKAAPENK